MKTNGIVNYRFRFVLFLACLFILAICFAYVFIPRITKPSSALANKEKSENTGNRGIKKAEVERAEQMKNARFSILKKHDRYFNLYSEMIGKPAPNFSLDNFVFHELILSTNFEDLESLRSNVVVINFGATSEKIGLPAISHLNELCDEFKGQPVCFIGITDDDKVKAGTLLDENTLKTYIGYDTGRQIFTDYNIDTLPHTVIVDKKGLIAAITYPRLVSKEVINNILLGREPNIRAFSTVKYGDAPSKLKLMKLDEKYLLYKTIEKNEIKKILQSASDKPTLTKEMQEDFESHVFHQLRWIIEGDFESYVWLKKRKTPDYKGDFSREAAKFEYDAILVRSPSTIITKTVSGNTTFISSVVQEPPHIIQFGFADIWLDMMQTNCTGASPEDTSSDWQELENRVGVDGIAAKVSVAVKTSAGDYNLITIIFYYDNNLSMFRTFKSMALTINKPLEDIPWNDMSSLMGKL